MSSEPESEEETWCLIESDPGVFTELIRDFGVTGLQVEELWSLEAEHFDALIPIHGLIFLFKWTTLQMGKNFGGNIIPDTELGEIFFARQMIQNACATQAVISVLLNLPDSIADIGNVLRDFKDFTKSFDPQLKGLALSNSEVIRTVHNSFARQPMFEFEDKIATKDEDAYHFVGYVPINGKLYELDGLRDGPIDLGEIPNGQNWTTKVRQVLQDKIASYTEGEIHFSLLAVVSDRLEELNKQMTAVTLAGSSPDSEVVLDIQKSINDELGKRQRYKLENVRRKHNYLPLIVQFLKELAYQKQLLPLYERAKSKQ